MLLKEAREILSYSRKVHRQGGLRACVISPCLPVDLDLLFYAQSGDIDALVCYYRMQDDAGDGTPQRRLAVIWSLEDNRSNLFTQVSMDALLKC